MVDLEPIPLADDHHTPTVPEAIPASPARTWRHRSVAIRKSNTGFFATLSLLAISLAHGLAIWWGLGGREGLTNGWPLWRDDHPLYYHSALVTRSFLTQSGTTAGYDPTFMAGYPKSVVFPASSTLPELVVWAFGHDRPELAYKTYVLVSAAAIPWLVALAAATWGLRAFGQAVSVALFLVYVWTDFPINYAAFGMLPYLLAIPLGLLATGVFAVYVTSGGLVWWLACVGLMSLSVLVHFTSAMVVVPAVALTYATACVTTRWREGAQARTTSSVARVQENRLIPWSRHLGVWLIPIAVLAVNAFWWLPGVWLASTKGASDFAFSHSRESVLDRLAQIFSTEAPVQSVLVGLGIAGLFVLFRKSLIRGSALLGFCVAGLFWGYLAGGLKSLDSLQPGRHTYAFFTGLAVAGGAFVAELRFELRVAAGAIGSRRLDRWLVIAAVVIALRMIVLPGENRRSLVEAIRSRLFVGEPFLSSRPSTRLLWVVDHVKEHLKPGERLLYEEGGFELPGVPDPFARGRFSGLLPERSGVELLGGPYLHAALTTNFTQFGEGALFGKTDWGREDFVRYARLYRPAAILCWSPRARRFCRSNPDLVKILDDEGAILIGRVLGFEGDTITGKARVLAQPGRLRVREMSPGLDGSIVLRYHFVPSLRVRPSIPIEPTFEESDPVPFVRLRPPPGTHEVELEMVSPYSVPWSRSREHDSRG